MKTVIGAESAADMLKRKQKEVDDMNMAGDASMKKAVSNIQTLLDNASSLEQLRVDFASAVALAKAPRPTDSVNQAGYDAMNKAVTGFSGMLTKATSLDQLRKDFAAVSHQEKPSFFMQKYAGIPVWGWGAIGVGSAAVLTVALKILFRKRGS